MTEHQEKLKRIISNIERVFLGKRNVVEMMLIATIAKGHVLIQDVPGVGKTSLASALSKSLDTSFKRIQFTPDTTPSDVIGFSMYNMDTGSFSYMKGAVLNNIVLADELNRTSPKTQAALLEVMEEYQVTVDGTTHPVPNPFMLIATQNPYEQYGTYPLPESQLDRFMMTISVGYPAEEVAAQIVQNSSKKPDIQPVANIQEIISMQQSVEEVFISKDICEYIVRIAVKTRNNPYLQTGISTRGTLLLTAAAKGRAFINNRDFVIPDDIIDLAQPVCAHRLILNSEGKAKRLSSEDILRNILKEVKVPLA